AVMTLDRQGARQALAGKMMHQAEEERQVGRLHTLLVEGQDERTLGGVKQEVRILRTFGYALVGKQGPSGVFAQEAFELAFGNIGIDGHAEGLDQPLTKAMSALVSSTSRSVRMTGKF